MTVTGFLIHAHVVLAFIARAAVALALAAVIVVPAVRLFARACERRRLPSATARARRRADREQRLDITPALRRAER